MNSKDSTSSSPQGSSQGLFPSTRWSVLLRVQHSNAKLARRALDLVCEVYWYPLYVVARHRRHLAHHDAQDRTQGFWCWFLENDHLTKARMDAGRFRSFLMTYFEHFLNNEWRKESALKRGGGAVHVSKDSEEWNERFEVEMGHHAAPEEHMEKVWQQAALDIAYREVQAAWLEAGRGELFEAIKEHAKAGSPRGVYADMAASFGLSQDSVRQYSKLWRTEIRAAIADWRQRS